MTEAVDSAPAEDLAAGARGGTLVLLGSAGSVTIQFLSLTILSRLLEPVDFGLVAMAAVFMTLGTLIRDFGLSTAALQSRTLTHQQASNFFWMNTGVAFMSALLLCAAAPAVGALYGDGRVGGLVPCFALVILVGGMGSQIQVQLARRLRFGVLVGSDLISQLVGMAAAIALAAWGAGYWALVVQQLVVAIVLLLIRWAAVGWVPSRFRRGHGARAFARTGAQLGAAQLLAFLQSNVDTVVIGTRFGAASLGYYSRAYQLLTTPASRLLDPLTQVVVTMLRRMESSGTDSGEAFRRIQFYVATFIVFIFAVAGGTAPELLPLLLGKQWQESVPVFQALAVAGAITAFNQVSYWAFLVHEKSRELLRYNLVSKPLAVMCIVGGSTFGLEGVAWGYALALACSWPLTLVWLWRTAQMRTAALLCDGLVVLFGGAVARVVAAEVTSLGVALPAMYAVLAGIVAGTAAMAAVVGIWPRGRRYVIDLAGFVGAQLARRTRGAHA